MMKQVQEITIKVNGKTITATIQLDAPGLSVDDFVSPQMILEVAATNRAMRYRSRHHANRVATLEPGTCLEEVGSRAKPPLRLVA